MEKLNFKLQVVTPLFLSGANQHKVELRPPSIRGALRFWFRAMMGGVVGGDWRQVKDLEAKVFGDTKQASKAIIRVKGPQPDPKPWDFKDEGISYLGYGLSEAKREYIAPSYQFDLELLIKDKELSPLYEGSMWLLVNLGGLGARTRRGFGGLKVLNVRGLFELQDIFQIPEGDSDKVLAHSFEEKLVKIQKVFSKFAGCQRSLKGEPPFSVLAPNYWVLKILNKPFTSWKEAMDWIGRELRRFREDRTGGPHTRTTGSKKTFSYYVSKDYNEVKKFLSSQVPSELKLPAFGMPLQFRFQSPKKTVIVRGEKHERRASPLFIRILQIPQGGYRVCLMNFRSHLLEGNERLRIEEIRGKKHSTVNIPGWKILDDFLGRFPGEEVKL